MSAGTALTPWRCRALLVLAVLAAYLAPLWNAGFCEIDDPRFTYENEHIKHLSPGRALSFFTDKTTLDGRGLWEGTYRPLRTLDFAIDWAIAGRSPRAFHLHSLLYHLLGSVLVFELFRRLAPGSLGGPLLGSLFFALHPAHVECVVWITSRGDLLVLLFFVGAAILHLARRFAGAALVFVLALMSKEAAVVFPAAALLLDLLARGRSSEGRRAPLPWIPYLVYGALAAGYYLYWRSLMPHHGHLVDWWGGSYGANLLTMARGLVYYARNLLLPVLVLFDYYVPATPRLDAGAAAGILLLAAVLLGCVRGSGRFRFAAAWFFVTLLPMSNLVQTVGIPTAERFLYLPSVGFALWAGCLAASVKPRRFAVAGSVAAVLCFGCLTFARAGVWRSTDRLYEDSAKKGPTPRSRVWLADVALEEAQAAYEAIRRGNRDPALAETMRSKAERVLALARDQMEELEVTLHIRPGAPGGLMLSKAANALVILDRPEEAHETAQRAIAFLAEAGVVEPHPHFNAALAARRLGTGLLEGIDPDRPRPADRPALTRAADYLTEAAEELSLARRAGYPDSDLRRTIAENFAAAAHLRVRAIGLGGAAAQDSDLAARAGRDYLRAAALFEELGSRQDAVSLYRRCLEVAPSAEARAALRRLER